MDQTNVGDARARVHVMAHDAKAELYDLNRDDRTALLTVLASHRELLDALKAALAELDDPDGYIHGLGAVADVLESKGRAAIHRAEGRS